MKTKIIQWFLFYTNLLSKTIKHTKRLWKDLVNLRIYQITSFNLQNKWHRKEKILFLLIFNLCTLKMIIIQTIKEGCIQWWHNWRKEGIKKISYQVPLKYMRLTKASSLLDYHLFCWLFFNLKKMRCKLKFSLVSQHHLW